MNLTAVKSLGNKPPLQVLTRETKDISILLLFEWWDDVCFTDYQAKNFAAINSAEIKGRMASLITLAMP